MPSCRRDGGRGGGKHVENSGGGGGSEWCGEFEGGKGEMTDMKNLGVGEGNGVEQQFSNCGSGRSTGSWRLWSALPAGM